MASIGDAILWIRGDRSQLDSDLRQVEGATRGWTGTVGSIIKTGLGTALGFLTAQAIPKIIEGLTSIVTEAMAAQETQAQLNAVLESTGGIAGVTADMANRYADELSKVTRFDDEAILSGENLLLTFTGIGKDVFPLATEAMLNMSTAMDQDLGTSAILLGKALNDPIQGVTALKRNGVMLTDAQEELIKKLVETGDVAGAQAIILGELQTEFGGAARAAGETLGGKLDILKNRFGNVKETVGNAVIPILTDLLENVIIPILPKIERFAELFGNLITALFDAGPASTEVKEVLSALFGEEMADKIMGVVEGIMNFATTLGDFVTNQVIPFVQEHGQQIKEVLIAIGIALGIVGIVVPVVGAVIAALTSPITLIVGLIALLAAAWIGNWGGIRDKTMEVIEFLKPYITEAIAFIRDFIGAFLEIVRAWWAEHGDQVMAIVNAFMTWVVNIIGDRIKNMALLISTILGAIKAFWDEHGAAIMAAAENAWNYIRGIIESVLGIINSIYLAFKSAFEGDWKGFGEHLRDAWDQAWDLITKILGDAWDTIKEIVSNLVDDIVSFITDTDWLAVGKSIITGLGNGMGAMAGWLRQAAINVAKAALDAIKGFFGIESPSQVMANQVGAPMGMGIVEGFLQSIPEVQAALQAKLGGLQVALANAGVGGPSYQYLLTAQYGFQAERSLIDDIRLLEMLHSL